MCSSDLDKDMKAALEDEQALVNMFKHLEKDFMSLQYVNGDPEKAVKAYKAEKERKETENISFTDKPAADRFGLRLELAGQISEKLEQQNIEKAEEEKITASVSKNGEVALDLRTLSAVSQERFVKALLFLKLSHNVLD